MVENLNTTNIDHSEMCLSILENTRDGNQLAPWHLSLVQAAIHQDLNDKGVTVFERLYHDVMAGNYRQPWLQDVEHMTCDHQGYIYYKGHYLEHFSRPYSKDQHPWLLELTSRCAHLESLGLTPNPGHAIFTWNWISAISKEHPYFGLIALGFYEIVGKDESLLISHHADDVEIEAIITGGKVKLTVSSDELAYDNFHRRQAEGWKTPDIGQGRHDDWSKNIKAINDTNTSIHQLTALLERYQVPSNIHELIMAKITV